MYKRQFTASAGDFSLVSGKYAYTPGNGTNTGTAQTDTQAAGTTVNLDAACNALLAKYPVALDGVTLAKIFAGTITKWNNSLIVADNPKLAVKVAIPVAAATTGAHAKPQKNGAAPINCLQNLTQENISVETRSAGSGTTFMFTDYLNQVDPTDFPTATQNAFASGTAAFTGSSTLAPAVAALDGSIGYVEYGFALQNGLTPARIKNATGAYVTLNAKSVAAAAADGLTAINAGTNGCTTKAFSMSTNAPAAADWAHAVKDSTTGNVTSSNVSGAPDVNTSCYSINNAPGAKDYPIAGFSYAITKGSTTVNATNTACLLYTSDAADE